MIESGRVLLDQAAGMASRGRHVLVAALDRGEPLRRLGQLSRPGPVPAGQRPAHQQHSTFGAGDLAGEQGQAQVLLQAFDISIHVKCRRTAQSRYSLSVRTSWAPCSAS